MRRGWQTSVKDTALGAAVAIALLTGSAHAKPWAKWAPDPLASDSTYAALSARPADSLTAGELSWLAVQRDWRMQRAEETRTAGFITQSWHPHGVRPTDARFAALASRPYAALADSEFAWLVAENTAQQTDPGSRPDDKSSSVVGIVVLAAIAGAVAGFLAFAYMLGQIRFP